MIRTSPSSRKLTSACQPVGDHPHLACVWHPSLPFREVSTATVSACTLPGPLVLSVGTSGGPGHDTFSTFSIPHGCLVRSSINLGAGRQATILQTFLVGHDCKPHSETRCRAAQCLRHVRPPPHQGPPSPMSLSSPAAALSVTVHEAYTLASVVSSRSSRAQATC